MRLERKTAVLVLAALALLGGIVLSANPEGQATPEGTATKPVARQVTTIGEKPWKPAELRPEHAVLSGLVGHFAVGGRVFNGPNIRPKDAEGTADGKLLMGGLFVQIMHTEKRLKQQFEGMMLYGFDEAVGKYTADSIDTTSTAIIHYVGSYDATKKQLNLTSRYSDQKSRQLTTARTVTTFVDAKTWTYDEFISLGAGGAETQTVALTFKRE